MTTTSDTFTDTDLRFIEAAITNEETVAKVRYEKVNDEHFVYADGSIPTELEIEIARVRLDQLTALREKIEGLVPE